jgi:hypothetical protein
MKALSNCQTQLNETQKQYQNLTENHDHFETTTRHDTTSPYRSRAQIADVAMQIKEHSQHLGELRKDRERSKRLLEQKQSEYMKLRERHRNSAKTLSRTKATVRRLQEAYPHSQPSTSPDPTEHENRSNHECTPQAVVQTVHVSEPPKLQTMRARQCGGIEYTPDVCLTVMALHELGVPASIPGLVIWFVMMFMRVATIIDVPSIATSTRNMRKMTPMSDAIGAVEWVDEGCSEIGVASDCTTHKGTQLSAETLYRDLTGTITHSLGALPVLNETAKTTVDCLRQRNTMSGQSCSTGLRFAQHKQPGPVFFERL